MSSRAPSPRYPYNGNLRLYNMFPYRYYLRSAGAPGAGAGLTEIAGSGSHAMGIDAMIAYIPAVAAMSYNAIWVNPLQATGTFRHSHPDGHSEVSGSLYAMADDKRFNPLIFPGCISTEECEAKLCEWTAAVRLHGMFPLFDLVLNHIGRDAEGDTPLQTKLGPDLLLAEINERWPDIQGLNYYKDGSRKRGLNTELEHLDRDKIDTIFEQLWRPFITRYINDYGFMGVRVDALTHIPVIVQQKAYDLVQQLVQAKYGTQAIIVGEFMGSSVEPYKHALSAIRLTHCLNPNSFFWSPAREGGYSNSHSSNYVKQSEMLSSAFLSRPIKLKSFQEISILSPSFNTLKKLRPHTIYLYNDARGVLYFALNDAATDICFGIAITGEINDLEENKDVISFLERYGHPDATESDKRKIRAELLEALKQSTTLQEIILASSPQTRPPGGLLGVIGNHDLGTLIAKTMLDIAYKMALDLSERDLVKQAKIEESYRLFKTTVIKGIKNVEELMGLLSEHFHLVDEQNTQLILELNLRVREKLFIQAMTNLGGWYSLAGDETGVCHKPEVFAEFAKDSARIGPVISEMIGHDFRQFIKSINSILFSLPPAKPDDYTTMHHSIIEWEEEDKRITSPLSVVIRYSAIENKYFIIGLATSQVHTDILKAHLAAFLVDEPCYAADAKRELIMIYPNGLLSTLESSDVKLPCIDGALPTTELHLLSLFKKPVPQRWYGAMEGSSVAPASPR